MRVVKYVQYPVKRKHLPEIHYPVKGTPTGKLLSEPVLGGEEGPPPELIPPEKEPPGISMYSINVAYSITDPDH